MSKYTSVIVGHVTLDKNIDCEGRAVTGIGGAALAASAAAHVLGHRVAVAAKCGDKSRLEKFSVPNEDLFYIPSVKSTDMVNVYHTPDKERRTCTCTSSGDPFLLSEIPVLDAEIYHLGGLLFGEFSLDIIKNLAKRTKIAFDVQGALRCRAQNGSMYFEDWKEKYEALPHIFYLKTDAAEAEIMTGLSDRHDAAKQLFSWGAKEVLITHNTEVLAYDGNEFLAFPIRSRNLSGRTGRGDTAFAAYLNERVHSPVRQALLTAAAAVSLKMEKPGPMTGTRDDVEQYIKRFYSDFI